MLKTLFHYFKQWWIKQPTNVTEYGLSLRLLPDYEIDIQLIYPTLDTYDINHIPEVAEKYAQLLLYINSSSLRHKLMDLLQSQGKTETKIKDKLFFDNVVAFHDIMRQELLQNRHNKGPLIRPTSVFRVK